MNDDLRFFRSQLTYLLRWNRIEEANALTGRYRTETERLRQQLQDSTALEMK